MVRQCWKKIWQFFKRLNTDLPYDLTIPLLGIHPRKMKTYVHMETCTRMFRALLRIAKK